MTSETPTSYIFDPSQIFPLKHKVEQLVANQLPAATLRWRSLPRGRNSHPKNLQTIVSIAPLDPFNTWSQILLEAFAKYCEFGFWISDISIPTGQKVVIFTLARLHAFSAQTYSSKWPPRVHKQKPRGIFEEGDLVHEWESLTWRKHRIGDPPPCWLVLACQSPHGQQSMQQPPPHQTHTHLHTGA